IGNDRVHGGGGKALLAKLCGQLAAAEIAPCQQGHGGRADFSLVVRVLRSTRRLRPSFPVPHGAVAPAGAWRGSAARFPPPASGSAATTGARCPCPGRCAL